MATVKATHVVEQNSNMLNGVQVDTTVYIGTGATSPIIQVGKNPNVYVLEGTQTAVAVAVVAGLINAYRGAQITVRLGTGSVAGTGIVSIVNGSHGGATVATITSGVGREATVTFDGVAWK